VFHDRARFHGFTFLAAAVLAGCTTSGSSPVPDAGSPSFEEAQATAAEAARADRARHSTMTFEEFEATVYKEPFEGGKYIVNGDTPVTDRKHLEEFFEGQVKEEPELPEDGVVELIVHQVGGLDAVWNSVQKNTLSYCVSTGFGPRYNTVVADMDAATAAWEEVAEVDFVHVTIRMRPARPATRTSCSTFGRSMSTASTWPEPSSPTSRALGATS
jgi:serine protease